MRRAVRHASGLLLFVAAVSGQQPNAPGVASATWGGVDGPPWPLATSVIGTSVALQVEGAPFQPYALAQAPAGLVGSGQLTPFGVLDLDLSGGVALLLDGLNQTANPLDALALIGPSGVADWVFPLVATVDLGGVQALVANPASPIGLTFSAATHVDLVLGQSLLSFQGDETVFVPTLLFGTVDFYGIGCAAPAFHANGHVDLAGPYLPTPVPSTSAFDSGPPRVAALWADLDLTFSPAVSFVETTLGFTYAVTAAQEAGFAPGVPQPGTANDFSVSYDYATAGWTLSFVGFQTTSAALTGITPGQGLANPATLVTDWAQNVGSCGPGAALPSGSPLRSFANAAPFPFTLGGCWVSFMPAAYVPGVPASAVAYAAF